MPPELVIGRAGDIDEIVRRLKEAIHTMLTGPRRIGKTTVCDAACKWAERDEMVIVDIEVPERADATDLLQLMIDRCNRISRAATGRRMLRAARPLIEKLLKEEGIPLDLSQLAGESDALPMRTILSLPLTLSEQTSQPVVFFLDELQRAADYADGEQALGDLVDVYSGRTDVVMLVDGSDERSLDELLGAPVQFGKLCDRLELNPTIPAYTWREGLVERFGQANLEIEPEALETLLAFGEGKPYPTMTAARYAALDARKLGSDTIGAFEVEMAIDEARRHLDEDA